MSMNVWSVGAMEAWNILTNSAFELESGKVSNALADLGVNKAEDLSFFLEANELKTILGLLDLLKRAPRARAIVALGLKLDNSTNPPRLIKKRSAGPGVSPGKSDAIVLNSSRVDQLTTLMYNDGICVTYQGKESVVGTHASQFAAIADILNYSDSYYDDNLLSQFGKVDTKVENIDFQALLSGEYEHPCQARLAELSVQLCALDASNKVCTGFLLPRRLTTTTGVVSHVYPLSSKPDLASRARNMLCDVKATPSGEMYDKDRHLPVENCVHVLAQVLERILAGLRTDATLASFIGFAVSGRCALVVESKRCYDAGKLRSEVTIRRIKLDSVIPLWMAWSQQALRHPGIDHLPDRAILNDTLRQLGVDPRTCLTQLIGSSGTSVYHVSMPRRFRCVAPSGTTHVLYGCRAVHPDFAVKVVHSLASYMREHEGIAAAAGHFAEAFQRHTGKMAPPFYAIAGIVCKGYSGAKANSTEAGEQLSSSMGNLLLAELPGCVPPENTDFDAVVNEDESAEAVELQQHFDDISLAQEAVAAEVCRTTRLNRSFSTGPVLASLTEANWSGGAFVLRAGIPLETWSSRAGIDSKTLAELVAEAGTIGLAAADAGGFVHRDLRLNNFVKLPDGVQLVDFDHACRTGSKVRLTKGAIFENRPTSMTTCTVGEEVTWTECDDVWMLLKLVLSLHAQGAWP